MTLSPNPKAVVVTGCSSGIGRATAEYLAQQGYIVLATVRKQADADSLRSQNLPTLIPICPVDLTKPDEIDSAAAAIKAELSARQIKGLFAIVNNAGGGGIAPIELMDVEKFHAELEIRLVAPVALLQAFLPLIREAHGRIIWIVTPSIIPIPFVSSIHACDFAVNCLARTLDIELKRWNIPNVMIRCGTIKTAAPDKSYRDLEADLQQWPRERLDLYSEALNKELKELNAYDAKRTEPVEVAKVVQRALELDHPRRRYQIGYLSWAAALLEVLPQSWADAIMARRA